MRHPNLRHNWFKRLKGVYCSSSHSIKSIWINHSTNSFPSYFSCFSIPIEKAIVSVATNSFHHFFVCSFIDIHWFDNCWCRRHFKLRWSKCKGERHYNLSGFNSLSSVCWYGIHTMDKLFQFACSSNHWFLPISSLFAAFAWHITAVIYSLHQKINDENENQPVVAYYVEAEHDPYKV